MNSETTVECDVLVIGSGASGLTAALAARKAGLNVLLAEKEHDFGGTTAVSGGVIWIPGNRLARENGGVDSRADAITYLARETGNRFDRERVELFLDQGPEMVDWLLRETEVTFAPMVYPDYHPGYEGSSLVRSLASVPYAPAKMGGLIKHLKPLLPQTVFLGLAVGSSAEAEQVMNAWRSFSGFLYVARNMATHLGQVIKYGRGEPIARGRALVARLLRSCADAGVTLWHSSGAQQLILENGRVTGAVLDRAGGKVRVNAKRAVILAAGGFTRDAKRRREFFGHLAEGKSHAAPTHDANTGDGIRLAEEVGGIFSADVSNPGAWMPVTVIPGRTGSHAVFPSLLDRTKPGFIAVTKHGKRFVNESCPYHDFVPALVRACEDEDDAYCWLIADKPTMRRYGIGFVKPAPIPYGAHLRNGYLKTGATLDELAKVCGIDAAGLAGTVANFNRNAKQGVDPEFNRGANQYDYYLGDDEHKPNASLGPIETGPFFAVKVIPGDLGTFAGIATDKYSRVLDGAGQIVPGLYAVGNDQRSAFAGAYPGAGATLGSGMTFAYIAARQIAAEAG